MLELSCESDTSYHWCYWEHGDKRYNTHNDDNDQVTELFTWVRSDTACGISISGAQDIHQGQYGLFYPISFVSCNHSFQENGNVIWQTQI